MRRETIVQDWKRAKHRTRGEVRQLDSYLTFVFFNYRNQMSVQSPANWIPIWWDHDQSKTQDHLAGRLASAELQTSEAGKSPLKAAIGSEERSDPNQ